LRLCKGQNQEFPEIPNTRFFTPRAPPPGPLHRLGSLIGLRFGDPPYRPIGSLDDRQIAALRAIAEAGHAWDSIVDLSADLRRRDLPDVREALR
jgi:hypothetical protein